MPSRWVGSAGTSFLHELQKARFTPVSIGHGQRGRKRAWPPTMAGSLPDHGFLLPSARHSQSTPSATAKQTVLPMTGQRRKVSDDFIMKKRHT